MTYFNLKASKADKTLNLLSLRMVNFAAEFDESFYDFLYRMIPEKSL
jgi:hypothetical protein